MILLLFPSIVYAVNVTSSEKYITCEYDAGLNFDPIERIKFKFIIYKSSDGSYQIEKYNYYQGKYSLMNYEYAMFSMAPSGNSPTIYILIVLQQKERLKFIIL